MATRIGLLSNASNPAHAVFRRNIEAAAASFERKFVPVEVCVPDEFDAALQTFVHERVELGLVTLDAMFLSERRRIAALAAAARLPIIYSFREHVEDGGMISYGIAFRENWRRGAIYVTMPVIGLLAGAFDAGRLRAFRQGLSETGYVDGRNVAIEYRSAEGHYDRLPALAADLVGRQVTVIASIGGTAAALAAKAATATIPTVFEVAVDPVEVGLVASLNRPSGNITGVTNLNVAVGAKRLELMDELVPKASVMALLINPKNPALSDALSRGVRAAARSLGLQLHVLNASTEPDFDTVFLTLVQLRAGGPVISPDQFFFSQIDQLAALALHYDVPTIDQYREFATAGGLMSYGASQPDLFRTVGSYIGRLLKGEKPADLPVQQNTKLELLINLKTAKALGLTIPRLIMERAHEVIE
jgi:putative ABC transport system substrate-binding protein